ncbi:MAG TPA: LysM peptidoglycan-binding domain-containing protein [Sedimentisphaerales bacterium]|nr:LysM peptidoglycan-binding domain-containing protein [Sedimentisphaerales bacterium]
MTSDAKIGLLLGLIFIFVIAFVINGWPGLGHEDDSNRLTTTMVDLQNETVGIGSSERAVINRSGPDSKVATTVTIVPPAEKTVRFETVLSNSTPAIRQDLETKAAEAVQAVQREAQKDDSKVKVTADRGQIYVVAEGDSLAAIAKKFYGAEQGNKIKNITLIFNSNAKELKSADEIYVGQRIIIPALVSGQSGNGSNKSGTGGSAPQKPASKADDGHSGRYRVREGDSLWAVAEEQLGDGSRYEEIFRQNRDVLNSEDELYVGMILKVPVR